MSEPNSLKNAVVKEVGSQPSVQQKKAQNTLERQSVQAFIIRAWPRGDHRCFR